MMVRGSVTLGIAALLFSAGAHIGGVQAFYKETPTKIEGGAQASVAMLGNSFRDVVQGELGEAPPDDVVEDVTPEPLPKAPKAKPAEMAAPQAQPEPINKPVQSASAEVTQPTAAKPQPMMAAPVKPTALSPQAAPIQSAPIEALKPVEAAPAPSKPVPTVLAALPDQAQMPVSSRPKLRPKAVEAEAAKRAPPKKVEAKPKKKVEKPKKKKASQGAKKKVERKGVTEGKAKGTSATTSSGKRKAKKGGNAAASNYPGIVKRKVFRVRRPRASRKASAVIAFKIAASGSLSSVRVSRSSGNAKFDRDAVNMIRRAAPFPKPPPGAKRSYGITIQSR